MKLEQLKLIKLDQLMKKEQFKLKLIILEQLK